MNFFKQLFCRKHEWKWIRNFEVENDFTGLYETSREYKCNKCNKIDYNVR